MRILAEARGIGAGRLGICLGADDRRLLGALGPDRACFLLARRAHARERGIERRAARQVGPLDPHVEDLDPVLARDAVERRPHVIHDALAFGGQQRGELDAPELVADFGAEDRAKLLAQLPLVPGANIHQGRIDDTIARERVDLEPALVGRQHLLALHVDVLDALVDPHELLGKRDTKVDPGARSTDRPSGFILVVDADWLTEAHDDGLLGLRNDRECAEQQEQQEEAGDGRNQRPAADEVGHWLGSRCWGCDFCTCGRGR